MIKKFWHVGFSVNNLDNAIAQYESLGFKLVQRFEKTQPKSLAAHMNHPNGSGIEMFQFIDKNHPQVEFIKQHIAFISNNIEEDLKILESQGCQVVIPVTAGVTVKKFSFIRDPNEQYIELAEINL